MRPTREFLPDVLPAAPSAAPMLPLVEWAALPPAARVADRLVEMRIAASEVRAELERKETAALAWIVPEIDGVLERIDQLLQRLAS